MEVQDLVDMEDKEDMVVMVVMEMKVILVMEDTVALIMETEDIIKLVTALKVTVTVRVTKCTLNKSIDIISSNLTSKYPLEFSSLCNLIIACLTKSVLTKDHLRSAF